MNILHIMHDYKPRIGGSVVRNASMIEAYNKGREDKLYLINLDGKKYASRECIDNVIIYRCKTLPGMIITAWRVVIRNNIEIMHAHNFRFMFVAFVIKFMCPWRHLKVVTEMHSVYKTKYFKEKIAYYLIRKSDAIIVLADSAKKYLVEKGKINGNIVTSISNGRTEIRYKQNKGFEIYGRLMEMKRKYCIAAYFGTFYAWQGVLFIAQNIDRILKECPELYIVMIGNGPDFDEVRELIQKCKYGDRILLWKGIEKDKLYNLYDLIDIILIPRLKNLSTDTAIPLKAVEAMEFSKCILAGNDNGLKEVLNDKNAGLFRSGSIEDFLLVLKKLLADGQLREKLGVQAKRDSQRLFHSWDSNALQINRIYRKILKLE